VIDLEASEIDQQVYLLLVSISEQRFKDGLDDEQVKIYPPELEVGEDDEWGQQGKE